MNHAIPRAASSRRVHVRAVVPPAARTFPADPPRWLQAVAILAGSALIVWLAVAK